MFSGFKKTYANLSALYDVFKRAQKLPKIIDYYYNSWINYGYNDDRDNPTHFRLFYTAFCSENLKDRFLPLVSGLDSQSCADVADIINGVIAVGKGGASAVRERQKGYAVQKKLRREFSGRILKLNDELYSWDKYLLPINNFEAISFYFRNGIGHLDNTSYFADKNIIDAGGFVGDSVLIFSPMTTGLVYSFEATSLNAALLQKTLELNNISNAVIVQAALGDKSGTIQIKGFFAHLSASTSSTDLPTPSAKDIDENKGFCEEAKLMALDSYVEENNLTNVGLIKMDIEGAEMSALYGAEKTIRAHRPTLIISIYHTPEDFFNIKPLLESWNLGYRFKIRRGPAWLICETLLIAEVPPEND